MRGWAAVLTGIAGAAQPALAHTAIEGVTGFQGGLLHPLLVPAHCLALLGLGLLFGRHPPPRRCALVALFAAGLGGGIAAIATAFAAENADAVVVAAAAVAGALVAFGRPLPLALSGAPGLALGVALAFDSVPQDISMQGTFLALAGTAVTALLAVMLVAGATAPMQHHWQLLGIRVLGSWIAASAILVLALRLTR